MSDIELGVFVWSLCTWRTFTLFVLLHKIRSLEYLDRKAFQLHSPMWPIPYCLQTSFHIWSQKHVSVIIFTWNSMYRKLITLHFVTSQRNSYSLCYFQMTVCLRTGWHRRMPCINWKRVRWILTPAERVRRVTRGEARRNRYPWRKATTILDRQRRKVHPRRDLETGRSILLYKNWIKKGKLFWGHLIRFNQHKS